MSLGMFLRKFRARFFYIYIYISRGGKAVSKALDEKCFPSSILKGGLEILLMVRFKIADEKRKYMERLK